MTGAIPAVLAALSAPAAVVPDVTAVPTLTERRGVPRAGGQGAVPAAFAAAAGTGAAGPADSTVVESRIGSERMPVVGGRAGPRAGAGGRPGVRAGMVGPRC